MVPVVEDPDPCIRSAPGRPWRPSSSRDIQAHLQAALRLPDALARFEVQLQADGRSPHTVARYQRHVRRFVSWFEADGLPDDVALLEPEHVARFLASAEALRRPDGRAKRTGSLNALRSSLRGFCAFLEASGLVERSPARVLRMARVGSTPPRGMRPEEVADLLAALAADTSVAGRRDHALFAFLLGTGARLGSALALEVGDVDLVAGTATLRELKGGGSMTVYLRPELVTVLTAAVGDRRSGPVFAGRDDGHFSPRHVQRRFEEWLRWAGIRGQYSPHSCRHAFALGLFGRTGDVLVVQAALGHRAISSTLVYARASAARVTAAVVG
jgi:integrase/recombinase XerD